MKIHKLQIILDLLNEIKKIKNKKKFTKNHEFL